MLLSGIRYRVLQLDESLLSTSILITQNRTTNNQSRHDSSSRKLEPVRRAELFQPTRHCVQLPHSMSSKICSGFIFCESSIIKMTLNLWRARCGLTREGPLRLVHRAVAVRMGARSQRLGIDDFHISSLSSLSFFYQVIANHGKSSLNKNTSFQMIDADI